MERLLFLRSVDLKQDRRVVETLMLLPNWRLATEDPYPRDRLAWTLLVALSVPAALDP